MKLLGDFRNNLKAFAGSLRISFSALVQCKTEEEREHWMNNLQRLIHVSPSHTDQPNIVAL